MIYPLCRCLRVVCVFAALIATACATSVEYAPLPEEVIVRADGAPYRLPIQSFAVSRDGRFVAFGAPGEPFGLGDDWAGLVVYDRRSRTVRGTCESPSVGLPLRGERWELSEHGRYVMVRERRCDMETGEVVDLEPFADAVFRFGAIVFFKDGSGAAYQDDSIPGVRVSYYDGRPDVVIPMTLPGLGLDDSRWLAELWLSSDRWGRRLLVSGYYWGPPSNWEVEHWVVSVADGTTRRIADHVLFSVVNGVERTGVFSDDGTAIAIGISPPDGRYEFFRLELASWELTAAGRGAVRPVTDELDDGRAVGNVWSGMTSYWLQPQWGGAIGLSDLSGESQPLTVDLSEHFASNLDAFATMVVAAPASHEVFFEVELDDDEGFALFVVPAPVAPAR